MARATEPPRLARLLATTCLRAEAREVIIGDLDQEFAETIACGISRSAATRHYWRQTLASIAAVRRGAHEERAMNSQTSFHPWQGLSLDLRSVWRALRRSPGYAAVAILSLALGIGANTAIFSVVRQLLLQPLAVDRPSELRLVYWTPNSTERLEISQIGSTGYRDPSGVQYRSNYSYAEFTAMRNAVNGAANLCGFNMVPHVTASVDGQPPASATGFLVSGDCFETIRPPLLIGRALAESDDVQGAQPTAVLGYGFWTRLFGGDRSVIGKTFRVNDTPVTIVGVTGAAYRGLSQAGFSPESDVTLTLGQQQLLAPEWTDPAQSLFTQPTMYWIRVLARVPTGADAGVTDTLHRALRQEMPNGGLTPSQAATMSLQLFPGARGIDSLRTSASQPLRILSVVVAVVLLIACINVAGLMLARGVARQRELAVRRALGAGRVRLMRELLLESAVLSITGGAVGVCLAVWSAPALQSMLTSGLGTSGVSVSLDWRLLAAAAALACAAGLLAGLLPAIRFSRQDNAMLNDRTTGSGSPRLVMGRVLLALQIAVSLPLVAGAGLFLRTIHNLASIDLGFNPHGLVPFTIDPTKSGKSPERSAIVFPQLLDRLEEIPGVSSATLLENALISNSESDSSVTVDGVEGDMYINAVAPHYFETMGVRLVSGRAISANDRAGTPVVVVVNETAARQFFHSPSPLGRHFTVGKRDVEVVGVAADAKYDGLREKVEPTMLESYLQRGDGAMHVAVRTSIDPSLFQRQIEQAVREVDQTLPITGYKTQAEQIDATLGKELVFTRLLTVFGAFALLLACIGLHGVTSYSVARRTSEIGVRLALGAQRSQVLWLILRQVIVLAIAGLVIGVPVAWLVGPTVRAFLFGLGPADPVTIAGSAIVMLIVAIAAGVLPARRAARMEALTALRSE